MVIINNIIRQHYWYFGATRHNLATTDFVHIPWLYPGHVTGNTDATEP